MITSSLAKPVEVRDADVEVGVAAGDAGGGGVGERGRAARGDQPPLRAGQRGQAAADGLRQLVEVHVVLGGGRHGLAHLGQHRGAADDRERAAGVDDRPDADRLVDVGTDAQAHPRGQRRPWPERAAWRRRRLGTSAGSRPGTASAPPRRPPFRNSSRREIPSAHVSSGDSGRFDLRDADDDCLPRRALIITRLDSRGRSILRPQLPTSRAGAVNDVF